MAPTLGKLEAADGHEARGNLIREACQKIREILAEVGMLPDPEWRNFMGSLDLLKQIESEEVKELIRDRQPHLNVW